MRQIFIYLVLLPQLGWAESNNPVPELGIGKVSIALAIVLLCIYLLAWVLKRHSGLRPMLSQSHIKVLSVTQLGQKEKLLLVQVGQEQILLGVTAQSINTLKTLEQPVIIEEPPTSTPFKETLKRVLQSKDKNKAKDMNESYDKNELGNK